MISKEEFATITTDLTMEEYAKMLEEDEKNIQAHPCCINCKYYSDDNGMPNCYYDNFQEDYELQDQFCNKWRSYVSGEECKDV